MKLFTTVLSAVSSTLLSVVCLACGDDAAAGPRNPHYVAAEAALKQGCFASSADCHGKGGGLSGLDLGAAIATGDIRGALVNVPACEYDLMDLVEPGDPDASWLMEKLTGDFVSLQDADPPTANHGDLLFTPDPSWDPSRKCTQAIRGFGQRMPQVAPFQASAKTIADIRTWIEKGAPGPNDPASDAGL